MELIIEHKEKENKKVKGKMMKKVLIAFLVIFLLVGISGLSICVIHSSVLSSKPDTSDWVFSESQWIRCSVRQRCHFPVFVLYPTRFD